MMMMMTAAGRDAQWWYGSPGPGPVQLGGGGKSRNHGPRRRMAPPGHRQFVHLGV